MSSPKIFGFPMDFSQVLLSSTSPTQQCPKRCQLTADIVLAIFDLRPMRSELDGTFVPCARLVRKLAAQFHVKERTVRDIWNRRSWSNVTRPHWSPSEIVAEFGVLQGDASFQHVLPAQTRKRGRPMGSKDTVKRFPKPAARREPAAATFLEIQIGALTEDDIYSLIADDVSEVASDATSDVTSDEDTFSLDTIVHADAISCDELESFTASCDEEYEEAMSSESECEGAMSSSCFESNPWSW